MASEAKVKTSELGRADSPSLAAESTCLWYCQRCTYMIHPAGSEGIVKEDLKRFCKKCAPFEVSNPVATVAVSRKTSPTRQFTDNVPENAGAAARSRFNSRPENGQGHSMGSGKNRSQNPTKAQAWMWVGGIASALVLMGVVLFVATSNTPAKQTAEAQKPSTVPIEIKTVTIRNDPSQSPAPIPLASAPPTPVAANAAAADIERGEMAKNLARADQLSRGLMPIAPAGDKSAVALGAKPSDALRKELSAGSTPVVVPTAAAPTAAEKAPGAIDSVANFEKQFTQFNRQLEDEKLADAALTLDKLPDIFSNAEWWSKSQGRIGEARQILKAKSDAFNQSAKAAIDEAVAATTFAQLDLLQKRWECKSCSNTSSTSGKKVLQLICDSRNRVKAEFDTRCKSLDELFDKIQAKQLAKGIGRGSGDPAQKVLAEVRTRIEADPSLYEKYSDRWAEANFDISAMRNPERLIYGVDANGSGTVDLSYDFQNPDQLKSWKYEGDCPESSSMTCDKSKKVLLLNVNKEHRFDPRTGKGGITAMIPFCFSASQPWSFDVDVALLKAVQRPKVDNAPNFGILISDGTNTLRAFVKESKRNELCLYTRSAPEDNEPGQCFPAHPEDGLRIHLECKDGHVYVMATSATKQIPARTALKFEPKFIGMYVESPDKDEKAVIGFGNIKLKGTLDSSSVKTIVSARRSEAVNSFKAQAPKFNKPLMMVLPKK